MAIGKKTGGRNFVKGDSRAGRPKLPPEIKYAAKVAKNEATARLAYFMKRSVADLKVLAKDESIQGLDAWIVRIILLGIVKGDEKRLSFMFDRLIGKVTEKVEHSLPKPVVIDYGNGETTTLGYELDDE